MRRAVISLPRRRHFDIPRRWSHNGPPLSQITTLPNKIRVATESTPGHFASVGLYIDAGARYETSASSGVSHFLDRMAFKTTGSRSGSDMSRAIDTLGGQIICSSSRESIMYQSSHSHKDTPLAVSLIADTVLNASFLPEEIQAQRNAARYEIREISSKPEMILPEVLHHVAYGGETLGNPLLCPEERVDAIDERTLRGCLKEWYRPERMVIAGAGVHHEELVELAHQHFSSLKPATASTPPPLSPRPPNTSTSPLLAMLNPPNPSIAKTLTRAASSYFYPSSSGSPVVPPLLLNRTPPSYVGGHRYIPDPSSEFNHLYVAFEGVGINDPDIYTLATIQVLLGGGGSFSAGGPGKGMYSRLYTHILNQFTQIDHCASFHHIYTDSALFGLFASVHPREGSGPAQILPHLVHQLSLLIYTPLQKQELLRARNQLKSSLMMALESRMVEVEDLGRQILVHGRKVDVTEMTRKVDEVTPESIQRVASRLFGPESNGKPTIVCMGQEDIGDYKPVFRKYGLASG